MEFEEALKLFCRDRLEDMLCPNDFGSEIEDYKFFFELGKKNKE